MKRAMTSKRLLAVLPIFSFEPPLQEMGRVFQGDIFRFPADHLVTPAMKDISVFHLASTANALTGLVGSFEHTI